jgi:photoactive yellow protein
LPYGVIQLKGEGTVVGYNKTEASLSKLDPARVVGKNFFRDIAPCTAVKEFAGELAKMRAFGANAKIGASISVQISSWSRARASGDGL